jgi:hypothetical protein
VSYSSERAAHTARALLDPRNRVPLGNLSSVVGLEYPGLYAWFVDQLGAEDLSAGLGVGIHAGLMYAGQAGAGASLATLGSRIRRNHIGGNTYASTLRLTLACILKAKLSLEPTGGRRMTRQGERPLTEWMYSHLEVSVAPYQDRATLASFEDAVLEHLDPPLNLEGMASSPARTRLSALRRGFSGSPPPPRAAVKRVDRLVPRETKPSARFTRGYTPEELARELGLPNAKQVRAFLRREFPRPAADLWSRWGLLEPEIEAAVRAHFGRRR